MNTSATRALPASVQPGWRIALPAYVATLCLILALFHETVQAMAAIWMRSDTYAHGFLVPPIALYLAWRKRLSLAALAPRHNYLAIALMAVAGFAWLLAELAAVNVVSQFALTLIIVLTVPALLGWPVARTLAFPLLFLFFAVPFGDFAMPQLMDWTASVTILGLRASGIPVHAEGLRFVIPSGSWSVVEACSGVRYLIASTTVGSLYAYLTYRSLHRRLVFVGVSIAVPIVANWLRAYMIVMLGHLSGNKIAVGVDHLIYGWVFFGIVIMAMFWIGARWREDDEEPAILPATTSNVPVPAGTSTSSLAAGLVTIAVIAVWPAADWHFEHDPAPPVGRIEPLPPIPGWQALSSSSEDWRPRYQNAAASVQQAFVRNGRTAGLYLAFYRNQDAQHKLVSSNNVLVTSDDPVWVRVASGNRELNLDQQVVNARSVELRSRDGRQLLVWQWYWVGGRWTASDAVAKVYTVLSRLGGKGDDAAAVIVYTSSSQAGEAAAVLGDFTSAAFPVIEASLRQTMALR